ncbi:MAG TPA: beta-L-arabinofuranosidase domain-containing protein, partial [Verrucomicrobiae bacterium]|nr:beta-L-arabinofuranosidase domain-containing protein [Verrucomicrobiae bacterium]
MKALCVILLGLMTVSAEGARLAPLEAEPLPLGAIKPAGWLRRQLEIQASGLSGHLDEFWLDVAESSWIGGKAEGWERGPYWLDGFIPLAIHLDNADFKARAQKWIDYILKTQKEDGWLGPLKGNPDPNSRLSQFDVWPRFILLKAMTQWQEATGDTRILPAMSRFLRRLDQVLDEKPLAEWARVRWADLSLSIYWLYDRTREPWLLDLAAKVQKQGLDWTKLGRDYPYHEKVTRTELEKFRDAAGGQWINDHFGATHGVNIAMGVKAPGVWSRQGGDFAAALSLLQHLDRYHGQATGMFAADEHVAGRHPSQGTELCAVVELMFSIENLLAIKPHVGLADRLESVAFNALPATFSDDMWTHQYDQQVNQVVCKISKERIYSNNGPESNLFGLEPTFGCCLANLHQGWPK